MNSRIKGIIVPPIIAFSILGIPDTLATLDGGKSLQSTSKTTVSYAKRAVQGFDMRVWISNQMVSGIQAWDCIGFYCWEEEPTYGCEYPAGSGIEHLWGSGPLIGGIVDGVRRVSEAYGDVPGNWKNFRPDPRHPLRERIWQTSARDSLTEPNRRNYDDDGDGRIDEDDLDGLDNDGDWNIETDDVGEDGIADINETGCQGGYDALINPDPAFDNYDRSGIDYCHPGANYYRKKDDPDLYTEKNGVPDHGEPHVDEDFAAISDNDLYCSAQDNLDVVPGHFPMGIKVIQKCYAWANEDVGAIIPFEYSFINISERVIRDAYVGIFADMDIGRGDITWFPSQNITCFFDSLKTAYVHNPVNRGATPLGITVLGTPKPLHALNFIYQWYRSGGVNWVDSSVYSLISGESSSPNLIATCDSRENISDVRFILSFGPFEEFLPGDTLKISLALVSGGALDEGPNNLNENARKAQRLFQRGYRPPVVLPSPSVSHTTGFKSVKLEWGGSAGPVNPFEVWDDSNMFVERFPPDHWRRINPPCVGVEPEDCSGGRTFEGYRVYRSEDPGDFPLRSSFSLVREYDLVDGIGLDLGLDSVFVDSPLVRGKRYWYAVTSFGIPDIRVSEAVMPGGDIIRDTLYYPSKESPMSENQFCVDVEFSTSTGPDQVRVVPNPYRVDENYTYESGGWEGRGRDWNEWKRKVKFIHLPDKCTIRIFSLTGDHITTLEYQATADRPNKGELDWNLLSESNRALASGVYVYTVESRFGRQIGKFVLIR